MAPPRGNKYALQNKGGQPPKYDLNKEAQDLIEWSLKEDSISLYQFTDKKDYPAEELHRFAKVHNEFSLALIKAKNRIAFRREQKVNNHEIKEVVYTKTIHVYDRITKAQANEDAEDELKRQMKRDTHLILEKKKAEQVNPIAPHHVLMNSLLDAIKGKPQPEPISLSDMEIDQQSGFDAQPRQD